LWDRIRQGFDLPDQQNARIEREADWFGRHQAYLDRVAERAQPYLHYIVDQVQRRGMPSEIALLPVVESAFQPYAYSSGRAAGIWQFIPGTGRRYGLKLNWWYDGRRDIMASTKAALDYLQYLHDTFDGDWLLALAAYNSGEGTVQKAIRANKRHHRPTDYWSLRLPRETEQYVPRLLALRQIVADPEQEGISLKSIADEPYLTAVKIDSQLDLATAAKMAEMDLDELHQLNPGFNRWATAPDGPHRLLVPLDKAAIFATNVAELSPEDRVHWVRHRVRNGETLGEIAIHYHTTVKVLTDLNKIRGHLIHRGQYLIIPITSGSDPVHLAVRHIHVPKEVANAREKTVHTVTAGDSLWSLAQHYGTTVRQLSRWNGISTRKILHPGQKIIVELGDAADNATGIVPVGLHMFTSPEEITKPRKITYTVRRGDSLSRISQRFRDDPTRQELERHQEKRTHSTRPGINPLRRPHRRFRAGISPHGM
jgi:membrane-bound lytic murein transglycosylase D